MNNLLAVEEEPEKRKNSGLTRKPEFFSGSLRLRISCWIHYIALEKHDHSSTSVITRPIVKHTSCFVLKPQITNKLLAKRSLQKTTCGHPAWLDQQNIILTRSSLIIIQHNYPAVSFAEYWVTWNDNQNKKCVSKETFWVKEYVKQSKKIQWRLEVRRVELFWPFNRARDIW